MQRILGLLIIFYSAILSAQESQYEQMKRTMDENSLPLVNMIVDIAAVNKAEFVSGEIEIADYQRRTDPTSDTVRYSCKYKIRGGTSAGYDKKSFAVKLYDEEGKDLNADIFGIRKENSWILDAMAIDRTRMRNRLCFDVWNSMSRTSYDTKYDNRNGTNGVFVEVFINGEYNGLYCLSDKIDRKLLGLKKAKLDDEGEVSIRGLLYKGIKWHGPDIYLLAYNEADTSQDTWNGWELQYPDDYPSDKTWQPLMDLIGFCSDNTPDDTFIQEYKDYFYPENLVDYAVFTMAMNVGDNAYKNTLLSTVDISKGHRYLLSPWDMDMSLGGLWNGNYDETLASIDRYENIAPFNRLSVQNIDGFKDMEARKWAEFSTTLFSCDSIARRVDHYAKLFTSSGAWEREYAKWNGSPVPLKENIADELEYVKSWYTMNYENLCAQFGSDITTALSNTDFGSRGDWGLFTIDGRRIHKNVMRKGVYIVKGRKVVIK